MKRLLQLFLVLALLLSIAPLALAQDDGTEVVEDAYQRYYDDGASVSGGDAEWTIDTSQFISHYPDGFEFVGSATSTGGNIVSVSIFYSMNPRFEDDERVRGEVLNPETGDARVVVEGPDADDIPPWAEVNYRWRFLDESGTIYLSDWFIGAEYEDRSRNWERVETDYAYVYLQEGVRAEVISLIGDALAKRRDMYIAFFGRPISYKPRIILFNDLETFNEWRGVEYIRGGAYVVGVSGPRWGGTAQAVIDGDLRGLAYDVVVHEVVHQYQFDLYKTSSAAWFTEGVASYFEIDKDYDYEQRVRDLAANYGLPPLFDDFGGPRPSDLGDDGRSRLGYDIGYTFIVWMVETYGVDFHRQLVERLTELEDIPSFEFFDEFNAAVEEVFGMPVEEIERAWRVWLGASAELPNEVAAPEPVDDPFFPAGTVISITTFPPLGTTREPAGIEFGAVCAPGTDAIVLQTVVASNNKNYVEIDCAGETGWVEEEILRQRQ